MLGLVEDQHGALADHRAQIGKTADVLVEGPSKRARNAAGGEVVQLTGRSMTDHIVVFDGTLRLVGHTVRVRVDDASAFTLYGRVSTGEGVGAAVAFTPEAVRAAAGPEEAPAYPAPLDYAPPAEKRIGLPLA